MKTYKLLKQRKNGTLGPLFIEASRVLPLGEPLEAICKPTKGFALRPGFHSTLRPDAPHLSGKGRVWVECEIPGRHYLRSEQPELFTGRNGMEDVPTDGYYLWPRPASQGGLWVISHKIILNRIMEPEEVAEVARQDAPIIPDIWQ